MASEGGVQLDSAGGLRWWIPTGLRGPPGIHLRSPARCLILRRFQAIRGGLRPGWTPKKIALSLAKFRASPPRIQFTPRRTRKINGFGAEVHQVSQLAPLANETDRSTLSSHDHPSVTHSPCDLEAKLHPSRKKEIPSDVSPKVVSLARRGLTNKTALMPEMVQCRDPEDQGSRNMRRLDHAACRSSHARFAAPQAARVPLAPSERTAATSRRPFGS